MNQHESLVIADAPAWSEASQAGFTGVDYLGTRAVNLELLTKVTGAYNNLIQSARQLAILAWAAWRFKETRTHADRQACRDFFDAVETIQLVGQRRFAPAFGSGGRGLGIDSNPTELGGGGIALRFAAYGRTHQTSALAAAQYGPAAGQDGFALIVQRDGVWMPTCRGVRVAEAMKPLLDSPELAMLERMPTPAAMPEAAVVAIAKRGLFVARGIQERPERPVLVEIALDMDKAAPGPRAATFALLLHLLQAHGPSSVDNLRRQLLSGCDHTGVPLAVPAQLHGTTRTWKVLQVRQLQRLVLEGWLAWAERRMSPAQPDADAMLAVVASERPDMHVTVQDRSLAFRQQRGQAATWAARAAKSDPLHLAARVEADPAEDPRAWTSALLDLTAGALWLGEDLAAAADPILCRIGGRRRASLSAWLEWWQTRSSENLPAALADHLQEWVLQQHVGTAMNRHTDEKQRIRISRDEIGWAMVPGVSPSHPARTSDRIPAMLSMLTDLGLVASVSGASSNITDQGQDALEHFLERFV